MVEVNEDALAVTMKIRRETRVAKDRAAAERAASSGELALPPPVPSAAPRSASLEATVSVPSAPATPATPIDQETAFRRARLGIAAAIALAILLVWIMQRRAASRRDSPRLV